MGGDWPPHDRLEFNPAHEAYDPELGLISTTGLYTYNQDRTVQNTSRIVYALKQNENGLNERTILAEIPYPSANIGLCQVGQNPDPNTWLK